MKKSKKAYNVYFKDKAFEEVINILNKEYPIKLTNGEELIDKIYNKYPLISKTEIAIIINTTFEAIRDFLVKGDSVNINNFVNGLRIKVVRQRGYISARSVVSTPKYFRSMPA